MSIVSITPYQVGETGQLLTRWKLITTDSLATITAAGYLNKTNLMGYTISPLDLLDVQYAYSAATGIGIYDTFIPSIVAGVITLSVDVSAGNVLLPVVSGDFASFSGTTGLIYDAGYLPSNAALTRVVMAGSATVIGRIAHFTDVLGTIDDSAGAVTNAGDIYAGLDAVAGVLRSYPATTTTGYFGITGVANSGAFSVVVSNSAHGQSTVYSLADIGASTGGIPVSTTAIKVKSVAGASAAGGAAAQSFTDTFCTTGSNVIGNWNTQTNAASVLKIVPGNGSFVVTSSADAGSGTFNYIITK